MVRKDPDTSYLWPSLNGDLTVRETMRQVVGQARDTFASHDCDPGSARRLTMVLDTLPVSSAPHHAGDLLSCDRPKNGARRSTSTFPTPSTAHSR